MNQYGDKKDPTSITFFTTEELLQELKTRYDGLIFGGVRFLKEGNWSVKKTRQGNPLVILSLVEILKDDLLKDEKERIKNWEEGE